MTRRWSTMAFAVAFASTPVRAQECPAEEHSLWFGTVTLGLGDCGGYGCGDHEGDTGPMSGMGGGVCV